jgi:hypothetical protein
VLTRLAGAKTRYSRHSCDGLLHRLGQGRTA